MATVLRIATPVLRAPQRIRLLPEVAEALSCGGPVVALESTIIAHGVPYPQNLELAKDVSGILRNKGVIPATVAIKNGVVRVGLSLEELKNLSQAGEEGRATKCSTRDLPLLAPKRLNHRDRCHSRDAGSSDSDDDNGAIHWGATTVAATMRIAHSAGIPTFVTGGTGGVHRGGEHSLDISADLIELSRTPVVVVSAGIKSILDIGRTLEVLETYGVLTGVWKADHFPSFFSPTSDFRAPARFQGATDVADAFFSGRELGLSNGMLVAVPNRDPAGENVEAAIQEALEEAKNSGVVGKAVTPFVLRTVAEKTGGDSLRSNISLVKNNAQVGADIALAVADIAASNGRQTGYMEASNLRFLDRPGVKSFRPRVVCVGGSVIDTIATPNAGNDMILGTSNPGTIHQSDGGVGRNIAEALGRLGCQPLFFTAVGKNDQGEGMIRRLQNECGVVTTSQSVHVAEGSNTAQYLALLDHSSELVGGIVDMHSLSKIPIPSAEDLDDVDFLIVDANVPMSKAIQAVHNAAKSGVKVCFEPTSVPKAQLLCANQQFLAHISYIFPNEDELLAMAEVFSDGIDNEQHAEHDCENDFKALKVAARQLLSKMDPEYACVVVTLGSRGVLLASRNSSLEKIDFTHYPADFISTVYSTNGAGDTFCGAFIYALLHGKKISYAVQFGMKAARLSLHCADRAVSPHLSSLTIDRADVISCS